ncbi:MAG: hypothetical protein H5T68_11390 [Chloroflexi bacterium]|nr:hypothetical protein [Chloroflexota bacterium]
MRNIAYSVWRMVGTEWRFLFLLWCVVFFIFRVPSDGLAQGGVWSAPFNCSNSAAYSEKPSIIVDHNGWVHVVWSEEGQILHRMRNASGWSDIATVARGHSPSLAADSTGRVYMAFAAQSEGGDDVYFVSWQAVSGWSLPVNVSESSAQSSSPRIAVAGDGALAIVWSEQTIEWAPIFLGRSADGEVWITMPIPYAYGSRPVLAYGPDGALWVAWQDVLDVGFPLEIFASQWTGSEWTLPEDVSYSFEVDSILPSIAVSEGNVYLAWQEGEPGEEAVYWAQWTDGAWGWPQKRSGTERAFAPALAVDASGYGHLVWTTEGAVQYASWDTGSGVWGSIESVALGQKGVSDACLAVADTVHVAWLAEAASGYPDVYYSRREITPVTPTPSATPTATSTATPTTTSTATAMPSATPTATFTATATVTATPSATPTATSTAMATPTPTATVTSVPGWKVLLPLVLYYE